MKSDISLNTQHSALKSITNHPVLLFDGVCNLCNGFVQFVILRDPHATFRFAALQSEAGQQLLQKAKLSATSLNTVVLYEQNQFYTHSDVALRIATHLGGWWRIFTIFKIIPKSVRDHIYNWIARNRYRWFGKQASCMVPTPALKARFL